MNFWNKKKEKVSSWYEQLPHPKDPLRWCFRLNKSPFKEFIIVFTNVRFAQHPNADGTTDFNFDYEILFSPKKLKENQIPKLEEILAKVLLNILDLWFDNQGSELDEIQVMELDANDK